MAFEIVDEMNEMARYLVPYRKAFEITSAFHEFARRSCFRLVDSVNAIAHRSRFRLVDTENEIAHRSRFRLVKTHPNTSTTCQPA